MASDRLKKNKKEAGAGSDTRALLIALALLTVLAGAGGWLAGAKLDMAAAPQASRAGVDKPRKAQAEMLAESSNVIVLPPILANLASPATTWVRMETALVIRPGEEIPAGLAAEISNDFLAYLRVSTLADIRGPTGLMYLREDLLDRARTRSKGKISHVLISGLVIE